MAHAEHDRSLLRRHLPNWPGIVLFLLFCAGLFVGMAILGTGHAAPATCPAGYPAPVTAPGGGTVFYVSPTGSDAAAGTSPCAAWQTPGRAAQAPLGPGDEVAFEGGASFPEAFSPWAGDSGTPSQPLTYTSYGTGQASLAGGIYLSSASWLDITDLDISSSASRGIGTSASGSGVTHVTVSGSEVTSSYDAGEGGYGIGLMSHADSDWLIAGDAIDDTADSGILSVGPDITVEGDTLSDDGIGAHCGDEPSTGWAGPQHNPCHAIYAKSAGWTITGNVITSSDATTAPATFSAISLRGSGNVVSDNEITGPGSDSGIGFWSETTTPGTTYITGNDISGELGTGIETAAGTEPIAESFVISGNDVSGVGAYDLFSYPPGDAAATLALSGNAFQAAASGAYLDLSGPPATPPPGLADTGTAPYTALTYSESDDSFSGSTSPTPFVACGGALDWSGYVGCLGGAVGAGDAVQEGTAAGVGPASHGSTGPSGPGAGAHGATGSTGSSKAPMGMRLVPEAGGHGRWMFEALLSSGEVCARGPRASKGLPACEWLISGHVAGYGVRLAHRFGGGGSRQGRRHARVAVTLVVRASGGQEQRASLSLGLGERKAQSAPLLPWRAASSRRR